MKVLAAEGAIAVVDAMTASYAVFRRSTYRAKRVDDDIAIRLREVFFPQSTTPLRHEMVDRIVKTMAKTSRTVAAG